MAKFLQVNLNRSRPAQDLALQLCTEEKIGVAILSEHHTTPNHPHWASSTDSLAAIHWRPRNCPNPCRSIATGEGYVAARVGTYIVFSCYFSPNRSLAEFEGYLERLSVEVRPFLPGVVIVAGDFNAKSPSWGCPRQDRRGRLLESWADSLGLALLNEGTVPTCVREQGSSTVDVTWASPAARALASGWRVADVESLSDHRYVLFSLGERDRLKPDHTATHFSRWRRDEMDLVLFREVLSTRLEMSPCPPPTVDDAATWLRDSITEACDATMPRVRGPNQHRPVYWWSEEIAELRRECVRRRRLLFRRRPRAGVEEVTRLRMDLRGARKTLRNAIRAAKSRAWQELVDSVERDPWGRPYLVVMNRLRPSAPPLTETMDPQVVHAVLDGLFPGGEVETPREDILPADWSPDLAVTDGEMRGACRHIRSGCVAPGPDGITNYILGAAHQPLRARFRECYSRCFEEGRFPSVWKRSRLVLLKKPGKPDDAPSSYRPICLLDEMGKLLERLIASRIHRHLRQPGCDLDDAVRFSGWSLHHRRCIAVSTIYGRDYGQGRSGSSR